MANRPQPWRPIRFWTTLNLALGMLLLAAASPARAQDENEERARIHFQAGTVHYDSADFEAALREFQAAYRLSPRPALLYNMYLANERLGNLEDAIENLEGYLEEGEVASSRRSVLQRRLTNMRRRLEEGSTTPDGDASEPSGEQEVPTEERLLPTSSTNASEMPAAGPETTLDVESTDVSEEGPDSATVLLLVGGGTVAIGGAVLLALGLSDRATVEDPPSGATWEESQDAYDRGPTLLTAGIIALSVGAAAAAVGTVWLLSSDDEDEARVSVGVGPVGVLVRGEYR